MTPAAIAALREVLTDQDVPPATFVWFEGQWYKLINGKYVEWNPDES